MLIGADYTHSVTLDKKCKEKWEEYCKRVSSGSAASGSFVGQVVEYQKKIREQKKTK